VSEQKRTRPGAGTPRRAKLEAGTEQATTSMTHDTTTSPPGQAVKIADFLSRGEGHAVPLRHLRDLLHLPARKIRSMIRAERISGTPILESSKADGGYYLPGNDHERARCVQRLRRRAAEIVKVADAIEGAGI